MKIENQLEAIKLHRAIITRENELVNLRQMFTALLTKFAKDDDVDLNTRIFDLDKLDFVEKVLQPTP